VELVSKPVDSATFSIGQMTQGSSSSQSWYDHIEGESDCEADDNSFTFQGDTTGSYVFNVTAEISARGELGDPDGASDSDLDTVELTIDVAE
jgi:hypothetical protein